MWKIVDTMGNLMETGHLAALDSSPGEQMTNKKIVPFVIVLLQLLSYLFVLLWSLSYVVAVDLNIADLLAK